MSDKSEGVGQADFELPRTLGQLARGQLGCGHPIQSIMPSTTGKATYECRWCADVKELEGKLATIEAALKGE